MTILRSKAVYTICENVKTPSVLSTASSVYWLLYERNYSRGNAWMPSLSWLPKTAANGIERSMIGATTLKRADWLSVILWCNWSPVRITRSGFSTSKTFPMNFTVSGSASLTGRLFPWASIASLQTPTPVTMCVSEIWTILNLPSSLTLKAVQASGLGLALPRSTLSFATGTFGWALSWSDDRMRVHCGRGSTASTPKRTSTSVTAWSILPENLLLSTQIPPGRLSHEWSELGLGSPILISITSRSSGTSSSSFASATYNHARCWDVYEYRSFSTRCHMRGSSSQVEGGTVGEKMHTVRSMTTGWATTAVVWEVDDVAALEGKIPKNSRARSIIASTADAIVKWHFKPQEDMWSQRWTLFQGEVDETVTSWRSNMVSSLSYLRLSVRDVLKVERRSKCEEAPPTPPTLSEETNRGLT